LKITIEGPQGTGKTKLARVVRDWLLAQGWSVAVYDDSIMSSEFTGDPTSRKIAAVYVESK
jgi:thymidylate kinase